MDDRILKDIPDFSDWAQAQSWIENRTAALKSLDQAARATFTSVAPPPEEKSPFGNIGSSLWRRFVLGLLAADWACYPLPADKADFIRLLYVVSNFPRGFRLWVCRLADGSVLPVGYTGWYPISKNIFDMLHVNPASITHRGVMFPLQNESPEGSYIYLFNYSLVKKLCGGTPESRRMLTAYAEDLSGLNVKGMAAVTVSRDGIRVAERFGLRHRGDMLFEGDREGVYTAVE